MGKQYSTELKLEAVERFDFIKDDRTTYRIVKLCNVLCVSRSSYYSWDKQSDSKKLLKIANY